MNLHPSRRRAIARNAAIALVLATLLIGAGAYLVFAASSTSAPPCASVPGPYSPTAPIKIGFLTELSGTSVADGYGARVAAELAVNATDASGGIDGKNVSLIFTDAQTNPRTASDCASILDHEGVVAITGTTDQGDALSVQTYAEGHSVPFVVSAVSSALLAPPGSSWTIDLQPDAVQWGAAVAKYVSQAVPGAKVALMTQNAEQEREMSAGVNWYASTYNNESIVFNELYSNAQFPWATAAAAAKFSGANAVIVSWISSVGFSQANVIEALQSAGFQQSQIFIISATDQISDLGVDGSGLRGAVLFDGSMSQGYANATSLVQSLQPFINGRLGLEQYCGICPTEVGPLYSYTYLGMQLIMNSIKSVLSSGQALTRADLMSTLRGASINDDFDNPLRLTSSGSVVGNYYIVQAGIQNVTGGLYPLQMVKTISFAPGVVPAYQLAKAR